MYFLENLDTYNPGTRQVLPEKPTRVNARGDAGSHARYHSTKEGGWKALALREFVQKTGTQQISATALRQIRCGTQGFSGQMGGRFN